MKQLQRCYLMNVMLYLKLSDIPKFILINKKSRDVCESSFTNPFNITKEFGDNEINIIKKTFPHLQTLNVSIKQRSYFELDYIQYDLIQFVDYEKRKEQFKLERYDKDDLFYKNCKLMNTSFPIEEDCKVSKLIINLNELDRIDVNLLKNLLNLKRIEIYVDNQTNIMGIEELITLLSDRITFVIRIEEDQIPFKLFKYQNVTLIQKTPFYYYRIVDENKIENYDSAFDKKYLPLYVCYEQEMPLIDLDLFEYLKTVEIKTDKIITLSNKISRLILDSDKVNIQNWNELTNISEIKIKTSCVIPHEFWKFKKLQMKVFDDKKTQFSTYSKFLSLFDLIILNINVILCYYLTKSEVEYDSLVLFSDIFLLIINTIYLFEFDNSLKKSDRSTLITNTFMGIVLIFQNYTHTIRFLFQLNMFMLISLLFTLSSKPYISTTKYLLSDWLYEKTKSYFISEMFQLYEQIVKVLKYPSIISFGLGIIVLFLYELIYFFFLRDSNEKYELFSLIFIYFSFTYNICHCQFLSSTERRHN